MDEYREAEVDERIAMNDYLDNYGLFIRVCKARGEDFAPIQFALLYHGYVTGGK